MTETAAMNLLGLKLSTEGKNRKPKTVTDYSEDDLLHAFRETCTMIGRQYLIPAQAPHAWLIKPYFQASQAPTARNIYFSASTNNGL